MAYRPTERTEARRLAIREKILDAAVKQLAREGFRGCSVAAVARRAGVATGTVYNHFPGKAALLGEAFRMASGREVDALRAAAAVAEPTTAAQLTAAVDTFARRAMAGPRLAWALLAEPIDPAVEAERLARRREFRDSFATILASGIERGELPEQDPSLTAAALVGAIGEALVVPVHPGGPHTDPDALVAGLCALALRAAGAAPAQKATGTFCTSEET